jgi:hypothetical protein
MSGKAQAPSASPPDKIAMVPATRTDISPNLHLAADPKPTLRHHLGGRNR